jgi:hypothetical protein
MTGPANPIASERSRNVTSLTVALKGATIEFNTPVRPDENCISTLTTAPPVVVDAIQKLPGVDVGVVVLFVE